MSKKVKFIRKYGSYKAGDEAKVSDKEAEFLFMNAFASNIPCNCPDDSKAECEDCKSKFKKKADKKAVVKSKKGATKK